MKLLIGHDDGVAAWVHRRIPGCLPFTKYMALGIIDCRGELVGGVVFHNYYPDRGVIEMSAASATARWLSPGLIAAIMDYPFRQMGCQMVIAHTAPENAAARRLLCGLGGIEITIPRYRGRGRDDVLICITDDAFHDSKFGGSSNGRDSRRAIVA